LTLNEELDDMRDRRNALRQRNDRALQALRLRASGTLDHRVYTTNPCVVIARLRLNATLHIRASLPGLGDQTDLVAVLDEREAAGAAAKGIVLYIDTPDDRRQLDVTYRLATLAIVRAARAIIIRRLAIAIRLHLRATKAKKLHMPLSLRDLRVSALRRRIVGSSLTSKILEKRKVIHVKK